MTMARTWSVALVGVEGHLVEVQADLAGGLPTLTVTGMPDVAVTQARDRVRAAVVNTGQSWPQKRVTIGLYPATLPKVGSGFDLAIAAAVLAADGVVGVERLQGLVLLGELGLDGRVRPVPGVLPAVLAACRAESPRVVVPAVCAREARLVPGAEVVGVASLRGLLALLRGEPCDEEPPAGETAAAPEFPLGPQPDLAQVAGQGEARRALEIAAAGGHHLYLLGEPGCGKTMLAERLPGLLPDLDPVTALEVTAVHSVAGVLRAGGPLVVRPPWRSPHHTATKAALVGGGSGVLRPGAASCAHRGVLFLDEAPEFSGGVLDALRESLESGVTQVARAHASATFPARFQLVLAANPCPCGALADVLCTCTPPVRRRYLAKLSGPLLDRVDLRLRLTRVTRADLLAPRGQAESSAVVAARVAAARDRAAHRWRGTPWRTNGEVPGPELTARCPLPERVLAQAYAGIRSAFLTARGVDAIARVARTIADLDGREHPDESDVAEAMALRSAR